MSHGDPMEPSDQSSLSSSAVVSAELKLYQAFIFAVPILFTFILLFLFYLFYLRRRRADWSSLRMRTSLENNDVLSRAELGIKKELREMLPIIIYKESFSVKDTQCAVCLADYQAEDRLQQIPACGHSFHMDCIDHWLINHSTCPLCRLSVLASAKAPSELPIIHAENSQRLSNIESSVPLRSMTSQDAQFIHPSEPRNGEVGNIQNNGEEGRSSICISHGGECRNTSNNSGELERSGGISENGQEPSNLEHSDGSYAKIRVPTCEETQAGQPSEPTSGDVRVLQSNSDEEERSSLHINQREGVQSTGNEDHEHSRGLHA